MDLETLLRIPFVEPEIGFDLSPDGTCVAFAWNESGKWEIYEAQLNRKSDVHRITSGPGAKFGPKYSPDKKHLAYVVDMDGSESFDIWICDLPSSTHTNLTPDTSFAIQPNFDWSPDGEKIAFISDQTGSFDTYIWDVTESGGAQLVSSSPNPDWKVTWSPDGQKLAITTESRAQDYLIKILQIGEGEITTITRDGVQLNAKDACWSPDGTRIAFSYCEDEYYQIGIYEISRGEFTKITFGEGDKTSPDWSPDGLGLIYLHSQGPDTWLTFSSLDGKSSKKFQVEAGVHYSHCFTTDGQKVVLTFGNSRHPEDLWSLNLQTAEWQQLTSSLPFGTMPEQFSLPREVTYPSLDGTLVPGLLFQPDGAAELPPAVIVVHGGPTWSFQYLWYPIFQHMIGKGWAVLLPNYRGSTGYGRPWQIANRYELGRLDTMDIVAGADYLVREGIADASRIAVTGRSHGGYLTMTCLTQYPDRWIAGSAVVPFLNWFTSHVNSREDLQHWDIENMGDPSENEELWRERSPFFYLENIQVPVQLICGENDPRCPASESIAARDVLQKLGKSVDFMLYPGEGHSLLNLSNVIDAESRRINFLARALEP